MRVLMAYLPTLPCPALTLRKMGRAHREDTPPEGCREQDGLSGTGFPFRENRPGGEESEPGRVRGRWWQGQRPGLRQH